ncbi:hypothetical protein GCM10007304_47400 [Rhodococcoides trifolii]|uniref:DUF4012 domain-containing protein n=1 Tax=Rhodococcoides trifolii TaxID=908250 RepID=A0A917LIX4_9NOCA|nr:DUF4012 domain-containing protein [Rhodococcus trifolii]GGG28072.1 hypothetical protein GCM10007304_47400 [Rhodococcus trifolii]
MTQSTIGKRSRKKPVLIGIGVVLILLIAFVAWLGYNAYSAQKSLTATRDAAEKAKNSLLGGDIPAAQQAAADAKKNADDAKSNTDSIPFTIASAIPFVGSPFDTVSQITDVVGGLATDVLVPAADAGSGVSPRGLVDGAGRVNLQPLRDAQPVLEQTSTAATDLDLAAQNIGESSYLSTVNDARIKLQNQTHELSGLLTNTYLASKLLPSMMGENGNRSYFLAFQTNAEARGTGGLLGAFGIVDANNGAISVRDLGPNSDLEYGQAPIDLGPGYAALWGARNTTTDFRNSNASPHFPYAGQIWSDLWRQQTGEQLSGTIGTDPIALSYILGATGPVTLPGGESITADNVVEITLSTAYTRFADDNAARKAYLQSIAEAVVTKMSTSASSNPQKLAEAVGRAASEGRLSVWSADPAEQDILGGTKVGHVLSAEPGPFADVVVNNAGGNKLDYYLQRTIDYTAEACTGPTRKSTVTTTLTNAVDPNGLPPYVASTFRADTPYGTNESIVYLYAAQGAKIGKVTVDGQLGFTVQSGTELGHPVNAIYLTIPPGETQTVTWEVEEPAVAGEATVPVQPLVDTPKVTVNVPQC